MPIPIPYSGPTGLSLVAVTLFGQRGQLRTHRAIAHQLAHDALGRLTTIVLPPSCPPHPGLGQIDPRADQLEVDGTLVPHLPGSVVVGQSRDCPYLVAENRETGLVGMAHAGRWSLVHDVVSNLIAAITKRGTLERIHCFITGGIRPGRFHHHEAPGLVAPLLDRHAAAVEPIITDSQRLSLDLFAVIRNELRLLGVRPEHIIDDGLCTYDHPGLGSKRADDAGIGGKDRSNWVAVRRLR